MEFVDDGIKFHDIRWSSAILRQGKRSNVILRCSEGSGSIDRITQILRSTCSENVIPSVLTRDLGIARGVTCHPRFFAEYRSE